MSTEPLSTTSFVVLGLLAQQGPSTPYDLKRYVSGGIDNFWSFPHTQLYTEPPRLAALELVAETREEGGRRRRVFTITPAGREALAAWLAEPGDARGEIRDPGLLQLYFGDLASPQDVARLATEQARRHGAQLAEYERIEQALQGVPAGWRSQPLRMGLRYEREAVAFWREVGNAAEDGSSTSATTGR